MEWLTQASLSNAFVASLLALLAAATGAFARRPALAHGLWLLVLLKLVTPPVALLPVRVGGSAVVPRDIPAVRTLAPVSEVEVVPEVDAVVEFEEDIPAATAPAAPPSMPLHVWLLAAWSAGALGWWGLAGWRILRFRRLLRDARPADDSLRDQVRVLAGRLGLTPPSVELVPGRIPPLIWSIGLAPRLILPEALWRELEGDARESLLIHELAHLHRRDHWTRCLELLTGGLYWWHPVAWWARRALREAEEQCCDAWVVAVRPESARTYARALLATLDFLSEPRLATPPAASGIGHVSCLKRRMTMIVRAQTPKALSWRGRLAVFTLGATLLPLAPTWAQRDEAPKDPPPAAEAPKRDDPKATVREHIDRYRRAMEDLGIVDESVKKQLDDAMGWVDRAIELGQLDEEGIRDALEQVGRDFDRSLERAKVAQRERREREEPRDADRTETPERRDALEKARAEIRELREKLQQAESRLAELQRGARSGARAGGGAGARGRGPQPRPVPPPPVNRRSRPLQPGDQAPGRRGGPPSRDAAPRRENPPDRSSDQRVKDVEEKLEKMLQELQNLKNELRGGDRDSNPRRS